LDAVLLYEPSHWSPRDEMFPVEWDSEEGTPWWRWARMRLLDGAAEAAEREKEGGSFYQ